MDHEEEEMNKSRLAVCHSVWFPKIPVLLIMVVIALATANRVVAQGGADIPLQFKMIGKFFDPEKDKSAGGVNAFTVNVQKKTWIFDIESSHIIGLILLSQVFQ